jgi:hypothetical protein
MDKRGHQFILGHTYRVIRHEIPIGPGHARNALTHCPYAMGGSSPRRVGVGKIRNVVFVEPLRADYDLSGNAEHGVAIYRPRRHGNRAVRRQERKRMLIKLLAVETDQVRHAEGQEQDERASVACPIVKIGGPVTADLDVDPPQWDGFNTPFRLLAMGERKLPVDAAKGFGDLIEPAADNGAHGRLLAFWWDLLPLA